MRRKIIPYNPKLKQIASILRKNMTKGEVLLWIRIKGKQVLGFDFDRQRPIDEYIVDFYCKELMLAIEIDGTSHDSINAKKKDKIRQRRLESLGVRFIRFDEMVVRDNTDWVVEEIKSWIIAHP